jgi:hypothetical protein
LLIPVYWIITELFSPVNWQSYKLISIIIFLLIVIILSEWKILSEVIKKSKKSLLILSIAMNSVSFLLTVFFICCFLKLLHGY